MFTTLAVCDPFILSSGFRAELQTDGRVYRLVSLDFTVYDIVDGHGVWSLATDGTADTWTVRAQCRCDDVRCGSPMDDAQIAEMLCAFWAAYVESPAEFGRDPAEVEQVNAAWWRRWSDHLTGCENDGTPISWALPEED